MADSNSGFSHFSKHKMYEIQKIRHSIHPLGSTDGDNRVVCIDRLEYVRMRGLSVVALCGQKLPDAVEVGVASRAWRAAALKTVSAQSEGVEF